MKNVKYLAIIEKLKELQKMSVDADIPLMITFGGTTDNQGEKLPMGMLMNADHVQILSMMSLVIKHLSSRVVDEEMSLDQYLEVIFNVIESSIKEVNKTGAEFHDASILNEKQEDKELDEFDDTFDGLDDNDIGSLFRNGKKIIN